MEDGPRKNYKLPSRRGSRWGRFCLVWVVLLVLVGSAVFAVLLARNLPHKALDLHAPASVFSEARARVHLMKLAEDIGPRPVHWEKGAPRPSDPNIAAFDYVAKVLRGFGKGVVVRGRKTVKASVPKASQLQRTVADAAAADMTPEPTFFSLGAVDPPEFQACSLPFTLPDCGAQIIHGTMALNYVAARIPGSARRKWPKALVLGCHIDTIPAQWSPGQRDIWQPLLDNGQLAGIRNQTSPGAATSAASCAALLEIGRSLAAHPGLADIILLFTNGEELNHVGARRFIADDVWFKDVGAFIEQQGSASRGVALASLGGDGNEAFLADALAASGAPNPRASSIYDDLGDWRRRGTDGTIFRVKGVPVMTLMQLEDHCPYHSMYDDVSHIPAGTLQANGDNLLAVTRYLTQKEDSLRRWASSAAVVASASGDASASRPVAYDVISVGRMVTYSWPTAVAVNATLVVLCLLVAVWQLWDELAEPETGAQDESELETPSESEDDFFGHMAKELSVANDEPEWLLHHSKQMARSRGTVFTQAFIFMNIMVAAVLAAVLGPSLEALLLWWVGKVGTWYQRDWFAFLLYGSCAVLMTLLVHLPVASRCCKVMQFLSARSVERYSGIAFVVLCCAAAVATTTAGLRCSYLLVWWAVCRAAGMALRWLLELCINLELWWLEVFLLLPATVLWLDTLRTLALNPVQSMGYFGSIVGNAEVDVALYVGMMWQVAVPQAAFMLRAGLRLLSVGVMALLATALLVTALVLPVRDFYPCELPGFV